MYITFLDLNILMVYHIGILKILFSIDIHQFREMYFSYSYIYLSFIEIDTLIYIITSYQH